MRRGTRLTMVFGCTLIAALAPALPPLTAAPAMDADTRQTCRFDGFRVVHAVGRAQVLRGRTPAAVISCDTKTGFAFALDPDVKRTKAVLDPEREGNERYRDFASAGVRLAYTAMRGSQRAVRGRSVRGGPVDEAAVTGPWLLARDGTVAWGDADGIHALEPGRPERLVAAGSVGSPAAGVTEASLAYADDATPRYARLAGRPAGPFSFKTRDGRTDPRSCNTGSAPIVFAVGRVHIRQRAEGVPVICDGRAGELGGQELADPGGEGVAARFTVWGVSGPWLVYEYRGYSGSLHLLNVRSGDGRYLADLDLRTSVAGAALAADGTAAWMTSQTGGPGTFQTLSALPAGASRVIEVASGQSAAGYPDAPLDAASLALSITGVPVVYWRGPGGAPASRPLVAPAEIGRGGGDGFAYRAGPGEANAVTTEVGTGEGKILSIFEDAGKVLPLSEDCAAERPDRVACSQNPPTNIGKPVVFDYRPHVALRDGDDSVVARTHGVVADGGAGDDRLTGGDISDRLSGGAGTDSLVAGAGEDVLVWSAGGDSYDGGDGRDTIYSAMSRAPVVLALDGLSEVENAIGGRGDDSLSGSAAANELDGREGADTIVAAAGDDSVAVNAGADRVDCGAGADVVTTLLRKGAFGPLTTCERLVVRDEQALGGFKDLITMRLDRSRLRAECEECSVTLRRSEGDLLIAGTVTYSDYSARVTDTVRLRITSP